MRRRLHCSLALSLVAILYVGEAHGEDSARPTWSPRAAADYLDGRADWWLGWSGAARGQGTACLSCHTTLPFALARPALARQLGESSASAAEKKLIDVLKKRVENWDKIVADPGSVNNPFLPFYSNKRKPSALGTETVLDALVLANYDARRGHGMLAPATEKALAHLWEQQKENGAWLWLHFGMNPWENDGAYYGASLAALAVGTAGKSYFERPHLQPKVAALKHYLRTHVSGQPLHHRVVLLWASSSLPDVLAAEDRKTLIAEIAAAQEADGGWSLPKLGKTEKGAWQSHGVYPGGASDGYVTGLVVLALKRGRIEADNPVLRKGLAWLAASQKDGTWPATYPNTRRDPQSDVGKFMRDAATAFAVLGLTEAGGAAK